MTHQHSTPQLTFTDIDGEVLILRTPGTFTAAGPEAYVATVTSKFGYTCLGLTRQDAAALRDALTQALAPETEGGTPPENAK